MKREKILENTNVPLRHAKFQSFLILRIPVKLDGKSSKFGTSPPKAGLFTLKLSLYLTREQTKSPDT